MKLLIYNLGYYTEINRRKTKGDKDSNVITSR